MVIDPSLGFEVNFPGFLGDPRMGGGGMDGGLKFNPLITKKTEWVYLLHLPPSS
jgi:hypothetical protein